MRKRAPVEVTDLFAWRAASDIEKRRRELSRRIEKLKPHAWRRIELQAELKLLTTEALKLETRA